MNQNSCTRRLCQLRRAFVRTFYCPCRHAPHVLPYFDLWFHTISCSLASQIHFRKRGKGLVNCVYKPCPTGMQLAGWRNQISNNALLNYLLQGKHAPWKLFSKCFYSSCSSGKYVLALFRCFQDCYCLLKQWCIMWQNTATWLGRTLQCRDKACIRSSPDPSLSCGTGSGLRDYISCMHDFWDSQIYIHIPPQFRFKLLVTCSINCSQKLQWLV